MSLIPGTNGQKTELIDGVKADLISELTVGNGVQLIGRTNGVAIGSGLVGEMFGTLSSGTNGYTYITTNTTALLANSVFSSVISRTFNKGIYFISCSTQCYSTQEAALMAYIKVGGTAINGAKHVRTGPSARGCATQSLPIAITADNTLVELWAACDATSGVGGAYNEFYAVRIA